LPFWENLRILQERPLFPDLISSAPEEHMRRTSLFGFLLGSLAIASIAAAQDSPPLMRDEVSAIKKKLVAALDALGQPPEGYAVKDESFNLPTSISPARSGGKFWPVYGSADRRYTTDVGAGKANKDFEKEYQQKLLDAQAKGDYQAMAAISQEMQKKMSERQKKATEKQKDPIQVDVQINQNPGNTIDPDGVLLEKPGVIAIRTDTDKENGKSRVLVAFDPVALKQTGTLSRLDLKMPEDGVSSKTAVMTIVVNFDGPSADVEAWARRIDTGKILAQISGK
jgi:hypothetical protein